jgi:hypothetical protein
VLLFKWRKGLTPFLLIPYSILVNLLFLEVISLGLSKINSKKTNIEQVGGAKKQQLALQFEA